jgi:hypothetical protein
MIYVGFYEDGIERKRVNSRAGIMKDVPVTRRFWCL